MSLSFKHLYEFGEFRLDIKEKILMRGDEHLELTPKGFELLSFFVENHGRLLGKDELMDKIWAQNFVEESNLTFNVRQLRKALGDDAHNPKYIKTVRQHGYRFIADVRQISDEERQETEIEARVSKPPEIVLTEKSTSRKFLLPLFLVCALLLIAAAVIGSWFARNKTSASGAPILFAPFSSEKLSTNGKSIHAALSPDGKIVVYTNGIGGDKQSVWLRQLEDGSIREIIPPSEDFYAGLVFSPDGNFLYFGRRPQKAESQLDIYRISIFGGIPQKIISETQGWLSLSPDGTKISFVRCYYREDENCSLWIADSSDGKSQRKLVSRPRPLRIGDNQISPDGKRIVFAAGQSATASNEFGLSEVDLESGAEREISREKFFNIKSLAWLPDKTGLLLTAWKVPGRNFRIWQISATTGEAVPLTKDSETYSVLSLDKAATQIISTQVKQDFHLRLLQKENLSLSRALANASSVSFAPNGKIYFSSNMSGNDEIWSINADGNGQRQLTNNPADEVVPIISPDNNSVFFVSNRTGAGQIWRMDTDGSNQTQITQKEGGAPLFVSPDGEWIYYRHSLSNNLWRVSTKGGNEQLILDKSKSRFAISPDGSQAAFSERQNDEKILNIVALATGQTVKTFHLDNKKSVLLNVVWMPDGKNLAYITSGQENENNILWLQPFEGGTPQQITTLGDEEMSEGSSLAVSPDGKTFAVIQGEWLHDIVLLKGLR